MKETELLFEKIGGSFLVNPTELSERLKQIKAFIFDWDGVFNNAQKNDSGGSPFNEVDSMGTNLLRFAYFLEYNELPVTAVISGEKNPPAFFFCEREHFHYSYFKIPNKIIALNHLCELHKLQAAEVAFVFDDVLDLSMAEKCGVRILIPRNGSSLFTKYVRENKLADYVSGSESGNFAVREVCELLMALSGKYESAIEERIRYNETYLKYLTTRNEITTAYFTRKGETIVEQKPE